MFCSKCGSQVNEGMKFCQNCGNALFPQEGVYQNYNDMSYAHHDIPKCTKCGHIGHWKKGPIIRKIDIFITIALLLLGFVPGLVYIGVVALIRTNENNREKICEKCGSQNLFTFEY